MTRPPIPLIVKALTGVLLEKRPTAAELARSLGGMVVKDDMVNGYRIKHSDNRLEDVDVRVSEVSAHPHSERIEDVTLLVKPGRALRLSDMSRVFGKPSGTRIQTAVAPGPNSIRLGRYSEIITVAFPDAPGGDHHHSHTNDRVELALSAELMHNPGPDSPDPFVTEVNINRFDWSEVH